MRISKVILTFLLLCFIACSKSTKDNLYGIYGNGKVIESQRQLIKFKNLIVNCDANINFEQTPYVSDCKILIDKNLQNYLVTSTSGDTLTIEFDEKSMPTKLEINIRASELYYLENNADIVFTNTNALKTRTFILQDKGEGILNLNFEADSLIIHHENDSKIHLDGGTNYLNVISNSSVDVYADRFNSNSSYIILNSSGDFISGTTKELYAKISGSGKIKYDEKPAKFNIEYKK